MRTHSDILFRWSGTAVCVLAAINFTAVGQVRAQDQYEFRFAFGTYCG